jgi:hypothetical protein
MDADKFGSDTDEFNCYVEMGHKLNPFLSCFDLIEGLEKFEKRENNLEE